MYHASILAALIARIFSVSIYAVPNPRHGYSIHADSFKKAFDAIDIFCLRITA
jgi:hypothetical protein